MNQTTSHVLMSEPMHFEFNAEAAVSNSFQNQPDNTPEELKLKVEQEFYRAAETLRSFGIDVTVIKGDLSIKVPDAIFPNNWFSTHESGELILYPMAVPNRRAERRSEIIKSLIDSHGYSLTDLSFYEEGNSPQYLEGTGSLIFDHTSKIVYAAISARTHEKLVRKVADLLDYNVVCFRSFGKSGELIYHTNVMMCMGATYVIIGKETVHSEDWPIVERSIRESGKELIELTNNQVYNHFAGNMLQVSNQVDQKLLVMSTSARKSLSFEQVDLLSQHNDYLVALDVPTIEHVGGGSARCMIAELRKVDVRTTSNL